MLTRFAPSLTGYLHLGHVLHMLYVWGIARANGADVLCRMEDHDRGRARPEFETAILEHMEWLGFIPDCGLSVASGLERSAYRQSDNAEHYESVLETLRVQGLVYGCACSRREIREQQPVGAGELCYAGTCREKNLPLEGHTVRFCVLPGSVSFGDGLLGECVQTPIEQCGDFSLRDRLGQWTYQFCCVCDDLRHGVDLVIRGEDILSSTARQIRLFEALGADAPAYFHHPLLVDSSGEKLSKRQRSESISVLRENGARPEELLGQVAFLGGLIPEHEALLLDDALDAVVKGLAN